MLLHNTTHTHMHRIIVTHTKPPNNIINRAEEAPEHLPISRRHRPTPQTKRHDDSKKNITKLWSQTIYKKKHILYRIVLECNGLNLKHVKNIFKDNKICLSMFSILNQSSSISILFYNHSQIYWKNVSLTKIRTAQLPPFQIVKWLYCSWNIE